MLALIPAFRPGGGGPGGRLAVVTAPDSVVAEAYRGLRTRLVQTGTSRNAKTLLVTSAGWEDKGTVAANLAAALPKSGRSVVLICADLRWGTAHRLFGLENGYGLSGFLEGRASLAEALQATEIRGLRVLPPGVVPVDPAALLQQPAWRTALSEIRELTDFVIIEAPPMLASPDTHPLADLSEMVLIVADARQSTRAQVRAAVREFGNVRGKLAGCVLSNRPGAATCDPASRRRPPMATPPSTGGRRPLRRLGTRSRSPTPPGRATARSSHLSRGRMDWCRTYRQTTTLNHSTPCPGHPAAEWPAGRQQAGAPGA